MAAHSNFTLPAVKMESYSHVQTRMVDICTFAESRQTLRNNAGSHPPQILTYCPIGCRRTRDQRPDK